MIRRSIAGLILGPSLLIGSLAWSSFLALRTVFDADRSRDVAEELLDDDEVRSQLTENLAGAISATLPADVSLSDDQVDQIATRVLDDPAVEEDVLSAFAAAHGAFLGEGSVPQTLDLSGTAGALREAIVEVIPALDSSVPESPTVRVTLPTDRIPNAGPVRDFLRTAVPVLAIIALAGCLLALLTTTDRSSVLTKTGIWALSTTVFYLLLGFGVPWLMSRYGPDQAEVFGALVAAVLRTTLVPSLVVALCGVAAIAAAVIWPDPEKRRLAEEADARRRRARSRGPVWDGPVPQPLVYPEPDWPAVAQRSRQPPSRQPRDPTVITQPEAAPKPAQSTGPATPVGPTAGTAPAPPAATSPTPTRQPASTPPRPSTPGPPRADLPPPLPTVASVSRAKTSPAGAPETEDDAGSRPPRIPDPSRGSSSRLPTTEEDDRPAKWRAPQWVEGHGWVMDPEDPKPPPPNARWVEGVGHVVPGPPPDK